MAKAKTNLSKRLLAALLSVVMVFSVIPFSATMALAATDEHPDAVTLTVKDEAGNFIENAEVAFTIDSQTNGDLWKSETKQTDKNGCVELLPTADFIADDLTLTATVSKDGFETNVTIADAAITSDDQNFEVVLISTTIDDVKIEGKTLTYNGAEQELVSITGLQDGDTVDYGTLPAGVTLNEDGEPVATNAGTYSLTVTVKRDGKTDLVETVTTIDKAKLSVKLEAKTVSYNETEQELVTVDGLQIGDNILWTVDGTSVTDDFVEITDLSNIGIPTAMAVNENPGYEVNLQVKRGDNYEVFNASVTVKMYRGELDLEGLTVDGLDSVYKVDEKGNPVAQNAVIVTPESGHPYTLMYQLDDGDQMPDDNAWVTDIPTVTNAGSYIVWVKAVKDGYNESEVPVNPAAGAVAPYNVYIAKAEPDFEFKSENLPQEITGKDSEIQTEVNFAAADNSQTGGTISYAIAFADAEAMQNQNIDDYATIDENGLLTLKKKTVNLTVTATLDETENYKGSTITHELKVFVEPDNAGDFIALDEEDYQEYTLGMPLPSNGYTVTQIGIKNTVEVFYDRTCQESCDALTGNVSGPWPKFKVHLNWAKDGMEEIANRIIAEKDNELELTVRVRHGAYLPERENDHDTYTIKVSFADFGQGALYTLDGEKAADNEWYKSAVTVKPATAEDGTPLYTIAKECRQDAFGDSVMFDDQGEKERYVYLKDNANGAIARAKVVDANDNNLKIDTQAPDASTISVKINGIDMSELTFLEKLGLYFGFYKPTVELEFIVADEIGEDESGVDYIKWYYVGEETPSTSEVGGTIEAEKQQDEEGNAYYSATLALPLQEATELRSKIALEAYDVAGNVSKLIQITKDGTPIVFVVDTISPKMSAAFQAEDENGVYQEKEVNGITKHYFNGNVAFTFTINEANFFEEDVTIQAEKDGATLDAQALGVQWTSDPENQAVHYGTFTLSGDGDYVVTLTYRDGQGDNSGNVLVDASTGETIETYVSETIVIDTAPAAMAFDFVEHKDDETETENFQAQKTKLTVTERNFDPQNLFVEPVEADESLAKDIVDNQIEDVTAEYLNAKLQDPDNWSVDDGAHVFETDDYVDGIYNFNIIYDDGVTEATTVNAAFTIDHTAPDEVKIEFVTDPLDTFLEIITLGFYNSPVEIKFTTTDDIKVVEKFDWAYTKTAGASTTNAASFGGSITEGIVQEGNTFTATVTLPAAENEETQQLLGYISASATDAYKNKSKTTEDADSRFVYDTIAPSMTVSYNEAQHEITTEAGDVTRAYYNGTTGDVTATFTVTEANFIAKDVEIAVTRDGEAFTDYTLSWENGDFTDKWGTETGAETADRYVGMLTLPAPADHSGDGDYVVYVKYHDRSQNDLQAENGLSASGSYQDEEKEYVEYASHTITIDTITPVISVAYQNTNLINTVKDRDEQDRRYFDDTQTATVTITEHNFDPDDVQFTIRATDVTGAELNADELYEKTDWHVDSTGDIHTITIAYPGDANYTFDVDYADLATNAADDYQPDYFTVDKTAPTNLTVSYSTSVLDTVLESLSFGFYNAKMTVTLTADDITSGVHNFKYSYLNAAGVSSVNAELIDQAIEAADIVYSENGLTGTATFEIPKLVLQGDNQFNGTVNFTAYDRANNETSAQDTKRIVVDSIAPTATVTYNTPVNTENGVSYYDGEVNATVTVTEANFYAQDVSVMVSRDGGAAYAVTPTWQDENADVHIGTFTLSGDGDYVITINYQDKSSNQMVTYTSNQLTIDTDIQAPTYSINGVAKTNEGGAYKNDATVAFSFEDQNFDTKTIKLERTRFNSVEDVTDEFIRSSDTNKGGSGSFEIPSEVENDGIYVLTISMTDKANHTTESSLKFTINRYGSVYEYSDYLTELLEKQYIKIDGNNSAAITQDLVITEYNANQILTDSLNILITRDGEAINTQYTSNPTVDGNAGIGESGWYQYEYTIAKENFAEDGVYKITLTSAYAADDSDRNESTSVPENSMDAAGNQILNTMDFTVDTTKPEIRNIVNLDKPIVNAQTLEVAYTIVDVGGLKSIEIIVNGSTIDTITEFGDNAFNYSGNFTLNESSAAQTVQIKVTDIAGNVTDTASDDFSTNDLYIFNDTITVSTNFFVRWYANQPLFWGSIVGVVVFAGVIWFLVAFKRRKKDDKEEK